MTGTPCTCGGWLIVANVSRSAGRVVRYFKCWSCGARPEANKTVSADIPPTRQRRRVRAAQSSKPVSTPSLPNRRIEE